MPKNNTSDVRYVNFNKYTHLPILENTPRNWVMNGRDNGNYKYVIDRYNGSTTNKAINNAYIDLAYGRGLGIHDQEDDSAELKGFLEIMSKNNLRNVLADNQILGAFCVQIHRQNGSKNKLAKIEHITKSNVIPSVKDDEGLIKSYWYSEDWTKKGQAKYKPVEYPAFGYAEDFDYELPEIYVGKPYQIGQEYFEKPDYDAALQYAQIEEELSNYYISHILNGLSFGSIVNIPNSKWWTDAEKDEFIKSSEKSLTGSSNAGQKAYNFMGTDSQPTTITNVENSTAHKQWDFLVKEASNKILSAHKCMSPALVGLSSSTGFSSVADEMDVMEQQLMKRIIAPKQDFVLNGISEILEFFGMSFDYYFRPLTEIEGEKEEEEKVNKGYVEEGVKDDLELSKYGACNCQKKKSDLDEFISLGEDEDLENFNLVDEIEVDYDEENKIELASTGVARPNSKSKQDGEDFVVRYKYVGKSSAKMNPKTDRNFCIKMMDAKKIYRKEDILQLENKKVNDTYTNKDGRIVGWGPKGSATYDIWLYKGGGNCHHKWNRVIYLKKGKNVDVNSPLAELISTSAARRKGYKLKTNDTKVSIEPRNMTNKGFLTAR